MCRCGVSSHSRETHHRKPLCRSRALTTTYTSLLAVSIILVWAMQIPATTSTRLPMVTLGENETASFDPIFFFHHCFVDKVFWDWQNQHHATKKFDIIEGYPGTNSVDSQGPTPGVAGGTWLTLKSPLDPFKKGDNPDGPPMTSEVSSLHNHRAHATS